MENVSIFQAIHYFPTSFTPGTNLLPYFKSVCQGESAEEIISLVKELLMTPKIL